MYKRITEGQILQITGSNLYPDNTRVYFNNTGVEAPIVPNSFSPNFNYVSVRVPSNLPRLNTLITYNGVNYHSGSNQYEFFGLPKIESFSDNAIYWGESVLVHGQYLLNATGASIDNDNANFYVESNNRVSVTCPQSVRTGQRDLTIKTENGQATSGITILEPSMEGDLTSESVNNGVRFSEYATVKGISLHRVNRVSVTGFHGVQYVSSNSFQLYGTTGLSFLVPEGAINGYPVTLEQQTGYYSSGNWYGQVFQSHTTTNNLKIVSPYLHAISTGAAKYQDTITVSGSQVENCKVMFSGYNSNQVEATTESTGFNQIQVSVPRGIIGGRLTIEGNNTSTSGSYTSTGYFYPIPTITGLSSNSWVVGNQVEIEAINAAEAMPLVGLRGYDNLYSSMGGTVYGTYTVSSPEGENINSVMYFGKATVDNSSLLSSLSTGVSKINATINLRALGNGHPFLVSKDEGLTFEGRDSFYNRVYHYPLYGEAVTISPKSPQILGLSKNRASKSDTISISGKYLITAKSLQLAGGGESKSITTGQFLDISEGSHPKVVFYQSGNENFYEQIQTINVKLSDFGFGGDNGTFTFLTP